MRRFEREKPDGGCAVTAVNVHRNTGKMPSWERAWHRHHTWHEVRRALWKMDDLSKMLPEVRLDYLARLKRYVAHLHTLPAPRLP